MEISTLDMSRRQARERPQSVAWAAPDHAWTFGEVETLTNRLAHALAAHGVDRGDRVACLTRHQPECAMLVLAAQKIGAVCMPVNWRLAAPEVRYIVDDGQAKVMLADPEFEPVVAALDVPSLTVRLATRPGGALPVWRDWIAAQPEHDPGFAPGPDDIALQLYSSGTTGLPKGVELSHRAMAHSHINGVSQEWAYDPRVHVNLNVLPAFHIAGAGVALMTHAFGGRSVTMPDFDPKAALDAIERERVTHAFLVPAMIQFMLAVPGVEARDLSSLSMISYGASPISERVLTDAMRIFGCGFLQVYGLTETCGAVTALRAHDHATEGPRAALLRSAGQPMQDVEVRVVRPGTTDECDDGEVGELWIRSPKNMTGYWRKPKATDEAFEPDPRGGPPWFRSGDAGFRRDGYLFLHDRLKDMIVSGGENIYPAEVENALMRHPAVADGAVIGVPDEKWGEAVKAVVVLKPGSSATEREIVDFVRERIAHYKSPKSVDFVDAIPRNPSGKILKRVLREPYWAGRDRRIA
ncbi:MAG: long-chain-fatty-acid--CoA ligase [Burkholderiales bacterium]